MQVKKKKEHKNIFFIYNLLLKNNVKVNTRINNILQT